MKVQFVTKKPQKSDVRVILLEKGKKPADSGLKRLVKVLGFEGEKAETVSCPAPEGMNARQLVFAGLGGAADQNGLGLEETGSALFKKLDALKAANASVAVEATGKIKADQIAARLALGARLESYRFDKYKTKKTDEKPKLKTLNFVLRSAAAAKKTYAPLHSVADGVFLARDLMLEPPNVLYPKTFAAQIKKQFTGTGVKVTVLGEAQMKKLGMGSLLSVGVGSDKESLLVIMEYSGLSKSTSAKKAKPLALVGKGVTFDTGGNSIKPRTMMSGMKFDMGGAAAVVGAIKALAARKAKTNVVGVVGLVENMISSKATRPDDVVKSMSGQTIEILNTDAEGRRVLADALWYVQKKYKPRAVIDLATLTGAIIMALGHKFGGVFSNDTALPKKLVAAGEATGDRAWHLPICDSFDRAIDSDIADMKDINYNVGAGSAVAAAFLRRFIQDKTPWAHIDIAGTGWTKQTRPGVPSIATGYGVRLLDRFIADNYE